jgi:hypothetical protein
MLKKISHIVLSLLLLVATMGMTVSKHYCKGNLYSISFNGSDKSCCDMANCCHDETQNIKLNDDFSSPSIASMPVLAEFDLLGQVMFGYTDSFTLHEEDINLRHVESPPPPLISETLSKRQVYLL